MRKCWNRQTGTFEGRVRERMGSSPICRTKPKQSEPISNQRWVRIVFAWNACAESGNSSIYMRLSSGEEMGNIPQHP